MIAVCDMGPLHYLVLIGCDHVLPRIFQRVVTARVVIEREMADPHTPEPVRLWAAHAPRAMARGPGADGGRRHPVAGEAWSAGRWRPAMISLASSVRMS